MTLHRTSLVRAIEIGRNAHADLSNLELSSAPNARAASLRRLARASGIPCSTFCRAAAIYLLYRRNPELIEYRHVGVCHVSVVLALELEDQIRFLRRTEERRWSRAQLQRAIRFAQANPRRAAGVPSTSPREASTLG